MINTKNLDDNERDNDLLRAFLLVLRSGIHAALEKRPVVQSEIDGEGNGRGGKHCDKEPTLPVIPRARGQEYAGHENRHPDDRLHDGLLIERIHSCLG